jgi:uncharacterized protein involved in tolerance to divalent cations
MIDRKTITKENLISLIQSSKTMEDAAVKLGVDRRTLLRLREKFGVVHVSANVNNKHEVRYEEEIKQPTLNEALGRIPEVKPSLREINLNADNNLNLLREVLVVNLPKEEKKKPSLEKFTGFIGKKTKEVEMEAIKSKLLIDTNDYTHIVISDCQVSPGVDTSYLEWIGKYIAYVKPQRVICLGDFADMKSLYNYKKENFDSEEYKADVKSAKDAMAILMKPILEEISKGEWKPSLDLTLGNHEHRITKVAKSDKKIGSFISVDDLEYEKYGWTVHDFLVPVTLDGIAYCHYFTATNMGAPIPSAKNLVDRKHMSCVMGHRQHYETHRASRPDGTNIVGLLAGSSYVHDEDYLGPQNNDYSRQIWVLNNIDRGSFTPVPIELKQLRRVYGN